MPSTIVRSMQRLAAIALSAMVVAGPMPAAGAEKSKAQGNPDAGRALALRACTGCHVVLPNQPFRPVLAGHVDFRTVANRPDTTAETLRRFLSSLHVAPPASHMATPALTKDEMENVIAFILTLRERH